ncbi:hypothetical protein PAAG_12666 [Paracoccidioides lutzii Pb01]|uniref:Uncharacterized protein n=1 Tax=Paracoccidioides lutzii (strain ATCC MYA-826 / Pb01) TaxID=502779 RepID=A0A0A2UYP9_PARBA|nr:hypothetical protein PAAG_12666 [Paracoccidioides lutzii Pb01]KGQ00676.1 hypothetical protein PAAG_12666 [Paracoccidioides lutzii Pb01]
MVLCLDNGLAGDSHVEICSPRNFSGWRSGIARPNEEQKAVGAVSCHQVSQIIMCQGLALRADADGQSPLAGRRVHRSLKPSTRNALVGLSLLCVDDGPAVAAHDLPGGGSW